MILHSVFLEGAPWFLLELLQWLWTFPFWYAPRNKSPFLRGTGQAWLCMTGLKAWIENLGPGESSIFKKTWMIYLHIVNLQRIQSISAKTVFPQRSQLYRDIFWSREGIITVLWGKLFFYISLFQREKKPHTTLESRGNKVTNETKLVHERLWMPSHHFPTKWHCFQGNFCNLLSRGIEDNCHSSWGRMHSLI